MLNDPFILVTTFIFGTLIGSFLNVVILRLPRPDSSIVFPPSHCPVCKADLHWYENIPLLSYILLRGRCGHCRVSISFQYPTVEFLTGIMAAACTAAFGFSYAALGYFIFAAALITIIWIDIQHQIIPDIISLPGIITGFCFSFLSPLVSWQDSLIGLLIGGGVFYAISMSYYLIRKQEGLGGGDIKLLAMLGAFLGWQSLFFIIFASSLTGLAGGLIAMRSQKKGGATRIPFGPFLAISGLVYLFFYERIQQFFLWYLTVFG